MWHRYINAGQVDEVLQILDEQGEKARIVAGATDLILEIERGVKKGIETLIDITRLPELGQITLDEEGLIHLGPLVTHNDCVGSKLIRERAFPLAQACWEVGSPQIRNRGTITGNLITASPANDSITPLMALGARVVLTSTRGTREVPLTRFYTGVRKTVMRADEMLIDIVFPALTPNQKGVYIKSALRQAQAISVANIAVILGFEGNKIRSAHITLGAVAPTIIHAEIAEQFLIGKTLTVQIGDECAALVREAAHPISDIRGSANYRRYMVGIMARRALARIAANDVGGNFPDAPVLLRTAQRSYSPEKDHWIDAAGPIETTINGKKYAFVTGQNKTLLRLLREDAGLIGTKEGCAEGECGACTVFLDGVAVMSCMVPAPRAHGAIIKTVEGVSEGGNLHPVQSAFISEGAVQCGYCTPGFIMSGVKLLEERPNPSQDDIKQALTGNLCRCTGYYTIIKAIEKAASGG
jgi:xanthine dehydrogenase iron-sulfur cluster and FAD-binding subunit A